MTLDDLKNQFKQFFNLSSYLEDENQAKQEIMEGVSFRGPNIIILIIAILIASLGLNINSPAVIIGAMLISPIMGPIIGIGLGLGIFDTTLIKRAARNLAAAALFSIIASTIYFLISPVSEGKSELIARASPTIYDVLIGFFGGAAGIVAIACKHKGNVIPGAAIATALLPPLCTAGYGIATWQLQFFFGALYLFIINSIFIALSTFLGVKLFKFTKVKFVDPAHRKKVKTWITVIAVATMLPSIFLTVQMLRDSFYTNDSNQFIEENFNFPNTQVFSHKAYIKKWKKYMEVTLIGAPVNIDSLQMALTAKLNEKSVLRGTHLSIKQGFSTSVGDTESHTAQLSDVFQSVISQIDGQKASIDSLKNIITARENFDSLSYAIAPEIKVLYPNITNIAISRTLMCNTDTRRVDTVNFALIEHSAQLRDMPVIQKYIETRTGLRNLHIIETDLR